jgi:hypothetical protein
VRVKSSDAHISRMQAPSQTSHCTSILVTPSTLGALPTSIVSYAHSIKISNPNFVEPICISKTFMLSYMNLAQNFQIFVSWKKYSEFFVPIRDYVTEHNSYESFIFTFVQNFKPKKKAKCKSFFLFWQEIINWWHKAKYVWGCLPLWVHYKIE